MGDTQSLGQCLAQRGGAGAGGTEKMDFVCHGPFLTRCFHC
jgi:hypothetical protein